MITCQCIGCSSVADRNVAGRFVCEMHYLSQGHIYFPYAAPSRFRDRHPAIWAIGFTIFAIWWIGGVVAGFVGLWRQSGL